MASSSSSNQQVNEAQAAAPPSSKFSEIAIGRGLKDVVGVVSNWSICRPIQKRDVPADPSADVDDPDDDFGLYEDNGPTGRGHDKLFFVSLTCGAEEPSCATKLNVYFYDRWAEKCRFLTKGDILIFNATPSIVHKHPDGDDRNEDDHACCLSVEEGAAHQFEVSVAKLVLV